MYLVKKASLTEKVAEGLTSRRPCLRKRWPETGCTRSRKGPMRSLSTSDTSPASCSAEPPRAALVAAAGAGLGAAGLAGAGAGGGANSGGGGEGGEWRAPARRAPGPGGARARGRVPAPDEGRSSFGLPSGRLEREEDGDAGVEGHEVLGGALVGARGLIHIGRIDEGHVDREEVTDDEAHAETKGGRGGQATA